MSKGNILVYSISGGYILLALISLCIKNFPVEYSASAGTIALFITAYEFFMSANQISRENKNQSTWTKIERKVTSVFIVLMLILIGLSFVGITFLYSNFLDEVIVAQIGNFTTFAAIGIVFLTQGMKMRTKIK
ncbi:hypothetical protein ACFYU8_06735 [Brevibacillus sp. NPDC003359]|uniref:hypothetical protein n=1 Tax=unclassified Brevibacillus TaxID=2684853 RepID=UPI0036AA3120